MCALCALDPVRPGQRPTHILHLQLLGPAAEGGQAHGLGEASCRCARLRNPSDLVEVTVAAPVGAEGGCRGGGRACGGQAGGVHLVAGAAAVALPLAGIASPGWCASHRLHTLNPSMHGPGGGSPPALPARRSDLHCAVAHPASKMKGRPARARKYGLSTSLHTTAAKMAATWASVLCACGHARSSQLPPDIAAARQSHMSPIAMHRVPVEAACRG